jgi:membrane protein implicated in regulation of membrane protease activity
MAPIAHAGHWSITLIYLAPFAVVAAWIARDNLRRRRRDGGSGRPGEER